jgi:diadenosine tetraphosphate (Ap4A) HIT family hydrolase/ADP-ribose pyrophosphatase YjhB (NUDIX family)
MESCGYCNYKNDKDVTVFFENDLCVCIEQPDPILVGSCVIIPKSHKETVFDLSYDEWKATKELIDKLKEYMDSKFKPDGYNVGWNCGEAGGQHGPFFHAHLHIIPRYSDEPFAGRGIRNWIKREDNMRPGSYKGNGRATGMVLHGNKIMFMQQVVNGKLCHVFAGGGVEENETPEQAVLRELKEEANIEGEILYGPVRKAGGARDYEHFFLITIDDNQVPALGYDPEIPEGEETALKGIVWRDIDDDLDKFTEIDKDYISLLTTHAMKQNVQADWLKTLLKIVS